MIPQYLSLSNFLSYRDRAELDMRGLHLACISGLNGAGKSTILDAITWGLFGKSRVRSDDDLVNRVTGAQGAAAEIVFIFELEGATYRVIRRKAIGKTTELEFHVRAGDANGQERWQVKTEARIRETQAEIEKLLHMNYEVFTNASFLLQGKADEFTTKTADRRKEILAEILGVDQWDAYKDLATDQRKASEAQANDMARQLAEVDVELAREEEYRRALEVAEANEMTLTAERERQSAVVALANQNRTMANQQREILRQTTADLEDAEGELKRVEATAAQRRAELERHQAVLDRREQIVAAFAEWQTAEREAQLWQEKSNQFEALDRERHPLEMAITRIETELAGRRKELEARGEEVARAAAEEKSVQQSTAAARTQLEKLESRAAEIADLAQRREEASIRLTRIESERKLHESQLARLQSQATERDQRAAERTQWEASLKSSVEARDRVLKSLDELAQRRQELTDIVAELATLDSEQKRLLKEGAAKRTLIDELLSDVGQDCPMCQQPLTPEHRDTVVTQLQAEGSEMNAQHAANRSRLASLNAREVALKKELERQANLEKERDREQATVNRAENRLEDLDRFLATWEDDALEAEIAQLAATLADDAEERELRALLESLKSAADEKRQLDQQIKTLSNQVARDETRLEGLTRRRRQWEEVESPALVLVRQQLDTNDYAQAEREGLTQVLARLEDVGYDAAAATAARARRDQLASSASEHQQLQQAEAAVKPLADGLNDLERRRELLLTRLVDLRARCEETTRMLHELEAGVGDLRAAEAELTRLRELVAQANRTTGAARQKVEVLQVRHEDKLRLTTARNEIAHRVSLLRQLEEACGRKGVQAMLIERALPEIEDYANDLLTTLTNGEMRIRFDTQRSKKKDDAQIETLDIVISDTAGSRPYENYSGGEQFRVNFAIRLALSQVLARRAGARLRTLVIDEGFGSQDPEGRQRLVEAINAVQSKFACILVITHVDELRDKFPARIDVERTPAGSRLSVVAI